MVYRNTVEFEAYGEFALFSDPITRVGGEKFSYPIPTYEALKGVLKSVYWKPTIIWYIDSVRIMNPIRTYSMGIRTLKMNKPETDLSYYTYLADVKYQVTAHFEWNMNFPQFENDRDENKHYFIALRSIDKGGRRDTFLGSRECQCYVEPCKFGDGSSFYDNSGNISFGTMYHGITYPDESYSEDTFEKITVNYWNPIMKNGVISFPKPENCPNHRTVRNAGMKAFG